MNDEWQPIETAVPPNRHSGDWVLGWAPGWMVVQMCFVHFPEAGWKTGWYVGDGKYIEPTHWRKMPPPPDVNTQKALDHPGGGSNQASTPRPIST